MLIEGTVNQRPSKGTAKMTTTKPPKTNPTLAVAYLRVSTDEQTLGMEAQRSAITAWASRQGVQVVTWCEDLGISGGAELEDRPGLLDALQTIRERKAGVLVAHKADRIARDAYVSLGVKRDLRDAGASLALVEGISGDDPFQELAATVMDAAAQFERRMIGARTKAALAEKRGKGQRISGRLPFGYRLQADGVHLEANPLEQAALSRIRELREAGMGGRRIAAILTAEGHTPRGKRWDPASMQRIADSVVERMS